MIFFLPDATPPAFVVENRIEIAQNQPKTVVRIKMAYNLAFWDREYFPESMLPLRSLIISRNSQKTF